MENFKLNTTITATVSGLSYGQKYNENSKSFEEDRTSFQVQTIVFKDNGEMVKKTLKVKKEVSEEQLKTMIGKTFDFSKIEEYSHNNNGFTTYTYSSEDFKPAKEQPKTPVFEVNKKLIIKVDNVIDNTNKNGVSTKLQTIVQDGLRTDLKTVKINDVKATDLQNLKGKEVLITDLRVSKMNGKTYYSSNSKPEAI